MQALYFDGKKISLEEMPKLSPAPGEALIRILLAGVCRTDIEIARGYMAFEGVPGHEFAGVVEECDEHEWPGKRVVGEINVHCGECAYCKEGLTRHCPRRAVLGILNKDGAFAEHLTLPVSNLHQVPDDMDDETAVFVEPAAACYEIVEQVEVKGKRVAVLGDGRLGILAARVLKAEGAAEVVLSGKHPDKLSLVRPDGISALPVEELASMVSDPFKKFPLVVEATGRPEGLKSALDAVSPRGVIVQKTTVAGPAEFDVSRLVVDEVTMIGSRCGPFQPAVAALSTGRVRVKDLISAVYPLEQGEEAIRAAAGPGALKVLIRVGDR
jgi:alcohol dehydrogenase